MVGEERAYLGYVITCYFQTRYGFRFFQLRSGCEKAEPVPGSFHTSFIPHVGSFHSSTWGYQKHNSYRVAMLYSAFVMQYSTNCKIIFRLFIPHVGSFHSPTWGFQRHNSYRVAMFAIVIYSVKWCKLQGEIISKMYLIENKEVTLLYKLNR